MTLFPGSPRFEADLDRIVEYYAVAADGVIEADGPYAWRFRPIRELRGPGNDTYRLELLSDCSLDPVEMGRLIGKPVFLLLSRGAGQNADSYEAQRCVNRQSPEVEEAIRARIGAGCATR